MKLAAVRTWILFGIAISTASTLGCMRPDKNKSKSEDPGSAAATTGPVTSSATEPAPSAKGDQPTNIPSAPSAPQTSLVSSDQLDPKLVVDLPKDDRSGIAVDPISTTTKTTTPTKTTATTKTDPGLYILSSQSRFIRCVTQEIVSQPSTQNYFLALFGELVLTAPNAARPITQLEFELESKGWTFYKNENLLSLYFQVNRHDTQRFFKINLSSKSRWALTNDLDAYGFKTSTLNSQLSLIGLNEAKGRDIQLSTSCATKKYAAEMPEQYYSTLPFPKNQNFFTTEISASTANYLKFNTKPFELESDSCTLLLHSNSKLSLNNVSQFKSQINSCVTENSSESQALEFLCDKDTFKTSSDFKRYKLEKLLGDKLFGVSKDKNSGNSPGRAQVSLPYDSQGEVSSSTDQGVLQSLLEPDQKLVSDVESALNILRLNIRTCNFK